MALVVQETNVEGVGADPNPENYYVLLPDGRWEGPFTRAMAESRCKELDNDPEPPTRKLRR